MAEKKPQIRRVSKTLRVKVRVRDYLAGEPIERETIVEIKVEEWLNRRTGRYGRMYVAREERRLGWNCERSARGAILRATIPLSPRAAWISDLARRAQALSYRDEGR